MNAQPVNDYTNDWKKVAELEKKGLTKSALDQVVKIFDAALKAGNQTQQIKAAMYQMKYRNLVQEDNRENNIFYLDTLISRTAAPARNILQSMQASLFLSYREANRYKLYGRTALTEETAKDINTWSIEKLNATMSALYKASLQNEALLKNTKLAGYDAILVKGENTRNLRPTLYDLLAHRALDYFMMEENNITNPSYKFVLNDERFFSAAQPFSTIKFSARDSSALYYNAGLVLQDLIRFHLADGNTDALLDVDLKRLEFVNEHGIFADKTKLYEASLIALEKAHPSNPIIARAMFQRALIYFEAGQKYDPVTAKDQQFSLKKAKTLLEEIIKRFPKSEGAILAQNQLIGISQPTLTMQTEKVNVPLTPFRSLVTYRNIPQLYFRVVAISHDEMQKIERNDYDKIWSSLSALKPIRTWNITLPDLQDYQQHSTEIKTDGLPAGSYLLLASRNADFSMADNIMARQFIYVSQISYINNNRSELYVLHRDNGQPLPNAEVQVWQQVYNYSTRNYEQVKKEKYTADKNGFVKLQTSKEYMNNYLQVKYQGEELFTDETVQLSGYSSYQAPTRKATFLFTDRSIYRPGQTIFFKGIVIVTDSATKKSQVVPGFAGNISLYDANNQKLQTLQWTTNAFGSYNGSFVLPEGTLNGSFSLRDANNAVFYFNVEEYKRPKFSTEIKKPEGTYRLNDSITMTGLAKAYAGNNIDGAKVIYRVVRKVRYPIWWFGGYRKIWPPYGRGAEMEIVNGETVSDEHGEFTIRFKAIPDEAVDKKSQPVFYYEITADVTDINGETRTGTTSVAVAYQALQLEITSEDKLPADSLTNIRISSKNMNDLFEKAKLNVTLLKLKSPVKVYRARYWEMPDQFVMSREDFEKAFPYDAYKDEDQPANWPVEKTVMQVTDTTTASGKFAFPSQKLSAGWYKILVTTTDKYGEEVKAEKYIQLTDGQAGSITDAIQVNVSPAIALPGEKINYTIKSGFEKIWLIHNIAKADKTVSAYYPVLSAGKDFDQTLNITEADRGGISLNYAFVQHNRVYSGDELIAVPWTNKELAVSYETFRDKILPGSEEKWTIKIAGEKSAQVAAETLVSMYDASLDQFKPHSWTSLKSLWPTIGNSLAWMQPGFSAINADVRNAVRETYLDGMNRAYDELTNVGWNDGSYYNDYRRDVVYSAAPMAARGEEVMANADARQMKVVNQKKELAGKIAMDTTSLAAATPAPIKNDAIQVRKNFNETAFFFPALTTDANGNVEFSFTIPEALTQWKLMALAHTKDLASGYAEKNVLTQKPLMVQPNAPRFLREGDQVEFSAKIVNMTDKEITGTTQLELFDAANNKPVDGWFKNVFPTQYFTVAAGQSFAVRFPVGIPVNFNSALTYRIRAIAKDGTFSDGEEAALPVLTNRMLVTETFPLNMRNTNTKNFRFDKLLNSGNSGSLTQHALTVEYTSNPAWYAVQALPYLMEYPYECAEQNFNRYYANVLASFISNSTPKIKAVFEKWKTLDTAALMSNLQKNEELKSALLAETPWVLAAQNETQQKKNIGILFDMVRLGNEKAATLKKLKDMQSPNGGFTWFKGGPDDRYITQYIITGIGHLKKLKALSIEDFNALKPIVDKGLIYLDARLKDDYSNLLKNKANLKNNNLSYIAIQYLYMRSFFTESKIAAGTQTAFTYYRDQSQKFWLSNSKYMQAMIALSLYRTNDAKTAQAITKSLKENSISNEELGMYWKEFTSGGYYWHQAPVESQALMIEAFSDIDQNSSVVDDMKTWLLKQKQTNQWASTKATAEACYALLLNGSNWLAEEKSVTISLGNTVIRSDANNSQAGTGYFKETIPGEKVQQGMGNITVNILQANNQAASASTSWGAVYWQYFEDLDKISSAATPLKLVKKLFIEKNSARGPVLQPLNDGDELHIGDKLKVRIELRADRDMEYIHMKDMRGACMEPVNVISGYKWQGGLGYYESTKDASTNFFFSWLPRGTYVFEYPMFVTHAGNFSNGITTIQSMYAPEFSSHSEGIRVNVSGGK
ncbi:MAG: alpha-2-macroglobulin [Ferruginibacter sp.]|nr:alpha-2-macroglobulin [Ferruginibacter sp.]